MKDLQQYGGMKTSNILYDETQPKIKLADSEPILFSSGKQRKIELDKRIALRYTIWAVL